MDRYPYRTSHLRRAQKSQRGHSTAPEPRWMNVAHPSLVSGCSCAMLPGLDLNHMPSTFPTRRQHPFALPSLLSLHLELKSESERHESFGNKTGSIQQLVQGPSFEVTATNRGAL